MAINPIVYTDKIVRSFLKYQLTTYPLADPRLYDQMRKELRLEHIRKTPLLRGPYISLSQGFRQGAAIDALIADRVLHPHMRQIIPPAITHLYGHQEKAIRAVHDGKTTLVSTGTGSGKTECFLYPIISKCLELKDAGAPSGICAVIVYPMNALAEDQLDRLRGLLAGSGVTFGMYVGKTPENERDVAGHCLAQGSSNADYQAVLGKYREQGRPDAVHPPEEVCSREKMRTVGSQPRILLTNVKQLELLLTRQVDVSLFADARLDFLVFDEAHTFTGISGAETACLIRRLRKFCGRDAGQTTCAATSATIVDRNDPDAAKKFAWRFFGVPAETVVTVNEEYQRDEWKTKRYLPPAPAADLGDLLTETLAAVDAENPEPAVRAVYRKLTGRTLPKGDWKEALFEDLRGNEVAAEIRASLLRPRELYLLLGELEKTVGRPISEEELLCYLTLGAASYKEGRPLLRPVVHGFIRGISGAVVTFPKNNEPKLWLSSEEELGRGNDEKWWRPRVFTCTTCGQHYYVSFLKDFGFTKAEPEGGQLAEDGRHYWEALDANNGGKRVVLVDRIINQEDESELEEGARTHLLYFCRYCGAAHPYEFGRCFGCGSMGEPVRLFVVREGKHPGQLSSCRSCGARGKPLGRRFREPIREVRAVNVSDVHVLAQDMVHHAERKRLLLFADNRQDAAFQAGWMKDHARRFRLRTLMAEAMKANPSTIGDLTLKLSEQLDQNDGLSRALIPEVWRAVPKEGAGGMHEDERLHFLRIQVLREVTMAANQQIGLEPWGRLKVAYRGLDASSRFVQKWSQKLGLPPDDLKAGVETLLDHLRRSRLLYDARRAIFSRYWQEGDREVQRGYLPVLPGPRGMKLTAAADDKKALVFQWLGQRNTLVREITKKWGVPEEEIGDFLKQLWDHLTDPAVAILIPVTLKSSKDKALANCSGVYQIDSSKLLLNENHGYFRCKRCRRKSMRRPPNNKCLAWQCDGELEFVGEDPDNYNLQLIDERYSMLRPEEHTAMVPQADRERYENFFKGAGDVVNTLVCTPTLELGVDIGALDSVLLRNVPPLPANYWQRAGRAGRRHRMAVNVAYCRPTSHDRAYFNDPLKMLEGRVDPPAFNMRNDVMVSKHVHAAAITRLYQLSRAGSGLAEADRACIRETLKEMLPGRISAYLFEPTGALRTGPFDVAPLRELIVRYSSDLAAHMQSVFQDGWPEADQEVATAEVLSQHVNRMADELDAVLTRLRKRLQWAFHEIQRLNVVRQQQGTLDQEDEAHFRRCDRLIKKLKGVQYHRRQEAEGIDDINTWGVLAAEGFLPGYGLDTGQIIGMAEVPYWQLGSMDFSLPRPPSMALREYVPGNLIYANGHRFSARRFHREADAERSETPNFEVNVGREAVTETNIGQAAGSLGASSLRAIPVCDVDLIHQSQIDDEEEMRFQMSVAVYGREQGRHNGGKNYGWGEKRLSIRRGVHFRMVNVGAASMVQQEKAEFGYPVCTVCGHSVSPLASERQLESFKTNHEERCGKKPERIGFFADIVADCLTLPACASQVEAYSVLEALRMSASHVLDMHLEDLQILVIGHVDRDEVDAVLWDPMPGGSGLLLQILDNFPRIVEHAREIALECPSACGSSCIDCLQTFRNSFYHKYLDRNVAAELLEHWGGSLKEEHDIPPTHPSPHVQNLDAQPVNNPETKLKHLLEAAGFMSGTFQQQIRFKEPIVLDHLIGSTTPDVYYRGDEDDDTDKGVCIYLDGLSTGLHGNPETAACDREIRGWLRNNGYQVIEITVVELDDRGAMVRHFKKLARYLEGKDLAKKIEEDRSWFVE